MIEDKKIPHPFKVPENFHNDFKTETIELIKQNTTAKKQIRCLKYSKAALKYAAIIAIAFLIGRYSNNSKDIKVEPTDLETIYNQVSEELIIEYVIEDDLLIEI